MRAVRSRTLFCFFLLFLVLFFILSFSRFCWLFQWLCHWSVLSCHAACGGHRLPRPSFASCCSSRLCRPGSHDFALCLSPVGLNPSTNAVDGTKNHRPHKSRSWRSAAQSRWYKRMYRRCTNVMDGTRECIDVAPCSGNNNDNDRSFSQLPAHNALTCREGPECLGSGPSLVGAGNSLDAKKKVFRSDLVPPPHGCCFWTSVLVVVALVLRCFQLSML